MSKAGGWKEVATVVEVDEDGTLRLAGYEAPSSRAEVYDVPVIRTPEDLLAAMDECEPLAWLVHYLYSEERSALLEKCDRAIDESDRTTANMPEDASEGAPPWLRSLAAARFDAEIVTAIEEWFGQEPDWDAERRFIDAAADATAAAKDPFERMPEVDLHALGVEIVEGVGPGSSYYAVELRKSIRAANAAASRLGLTVRFLRRAESRGD